MFDFKWLTTECSCFGKKTDNLNYSLILILNVLTFNDWVLVVLGNKPISYRMINM